MTFSSLKFGPKWPNFEFGHFKTALKWPKLEFFEKIKKKIAKMAENIRQTTKIAKNGQKLNFESLQLSQNGRNLAFYQFQTA